MANRVMGMKFRKLKMQNRALPRRLSIDVKGPRPSREMISEYRQRAASLGVDEANTWWRDMTGRLTNSPIANTPPGKYDINKRKASILNAFDDPHFYTHHEIELIQRVRVYFNSQQNLFCIQWMRWSKNEYRISVLYPEKDYMIQKFEKGTILWKLIKEIK